ncbi:Gfo/Idh/MocA family oxidoreductase [Candidatus Sumerlaeota bacterium]|nr:Gfo/Idh/MocA family oxidoreductase [Candidatus Sumerlaeota bacterium]
MGKVKIGFVGVGAMGQCAHLKNYVTIPECEVSAIAEIRPRLEKMVAARYGVSKVYSTHKEMLAKESLDGIVASQPFNRHGHIVPDLLKAEIPLFIEKPLAASVEMGDKILKALKKSGTWIMVGYHKRSDPATMYVKEVMEGFRKTKSLGSLKYIRITMPSGDWVAGGFNDLMGIEETQPALEFDPAAKNMDSKTYEFYISFVNYYIHQVNLMRHLLGEDYTVTYAEPSGVIMNIQSKSGVPGIIEMTPYSTTVDWQESALIAYEKGYVRLNLPAPLASNRAGTVEIFRDQGGGSSPKTIHPQMPWIHAMRQQAINFIRAIKGETPPPCTAEEAYKDLITAMEYTKLFKGA